MTRELREQLDSICRIIRETVDVEKIYLFGSYAYGTPDKDSDLDIYVVIPDGGKNPLDAMRDIVGAMFYRVDMPVDVLADYAGRFQKYQEGPTLQRKIVREGVLLYDRIHEGVA